MWRGKDRLAFAFFERPGMEREVVVRSTLPWATSIVTADKLPARVPLSKTPSLLEICFNHEFHTNIHR